MDADFNHYEGENIALHHDNYRRPVKLEFILKFEYTFFIFDESCSRLGLRSNYRV